MLQIKQGLPLITHRDTKVTSMQLQLVLCNLFIAFFIFSMGIDGDIFQLCKDGQLMKIKQWLDNTENDLNQGDDHWFTPLHWASRNGRIEVVELLISRGTI